MAEWKTAYKDEMYRQYTHYTGERPERRGRLLPTALLRGSLHIRGRVEYCASEPKPIRPDFHLWSSKYQLTPWRFRFIADEDCVFEFSVDHAFDQGVARFYVARAGQEMEMSQDELDWARYWGEHGCPVGKHPADLFSEGGQEGDE